MKKTAFSKPGSFSSAKRTASSAAPSSGNRLWEKKPSQGFKKFGHGKPGQSEDGKPSGDKRYVLSLVSWICLAGRSEQALDDEKRG